MIASLYHDTGDTLTRLANTMIDERRHATFTADADWEVTHYGLMEVVGGPSMLSPLPEPTTVKAGNFLTLDLKGVTFEFIDLEWPSVIGVEDVHRNY